MSLSAKQKDDTRRELKENFDLAGVSVQQVARDLGTTEEYIMQLMQLEPKRLEDTWILKNYLIEKIKKTGGTPIAFTALGGDYHVISFLNPEYIDGEKIIEIRR